MFVLRLLVMAWTTKFRPIRFRLKIAYKITSLVNKPLNMLKILKFNSLSTKNP